MRSVALQATLVLAGLFFAIIAGAYPLYAELWHAAWRLPGHSELAPMFTSVFLVLGIFLLPAVPRPAGHRTVIAFAAWWSLAHAAVMPVQAAQAGPGDFLGPIAIFTLIGVLLISLLPARGAHLIPEVATGARGPRS